MKKIFGLLVGLAALCPAPARADGWAPGSPPYRIEAGVNAYFRVIPCPTPPLAPWYTYWPYEAHFQTPAPLGHYPYWPTQGLPANPTMHMPTPAPTGTSGNAPTGFRPAGYSQVPSYWYSR